MRPHLMFLYLKAEGAAHHIFRAGPELTARLNSKNSYLEADTTLYVGALKIGSSS